MAPFGFPQAQWDRVKEEVREILIAYAQAQIVVSYADLVEEVRTVRFEVRDARLFTILEEISMKEHAAGRGMLSALVICKRNGMSPGAGFLELAARLGRDTRNVELCWIEELKRVCDSWELPLLDPKMIAPQEEERPGEERRARSSWGLPFASVLAAVGNVLGWLMPGIFKNQEIPQESSEEKKDPPVWKEPVLEGGEQKQGLSPVYPLDTAQRVALVAALLQYGKAVEDDPIFTTDPQANTFLLENPFAFLLGVIADQGIPAERAWQFPYELCQRLGHLDPERISKNRATVVAAIKASPALHRYVEKMGNWVVLAALRIWSLHGGRAEGRWNDTPTAAVLQERLCQFPGIGQKKAAMAVEILERHLHVPISRLCGSDIAYDRHIRRVFLRTCLAERDDRDHMIAVARELYPSRPGALDDPAWRVGRQWCHARQPDCGSCLLTSICPKQIDRAKTVGAD